MKKLLLILICGLLIGCGGQSNYGDNGVIKGKILRPGFLPPGPNNVAYVSIQGVSGYTGKTLNAYVNNDDGTFSVDINLGIKSLGPPVEYNNLATFDLKLNVNGIWWIATVGATDATAFNAKLPVEAGKITDIGEVVLDRPDFSFWN